MSEKTRDEIEDLKAQWRADPCWDIEGTDGFEAHHDELLAYRREQESAWQEQRHNELLEKAKLLGSPGNTTLAGYVEMLERRIDQLAEITDRLAA